MKAIFAHDTILYKNNPNEYYTNGNLPYEVFQRYLQHFNELTVISRCQDISTLESTKGLKLSSGPNVSFVPVPSLSNPRAMLFKRNKAQKILFDEISKADALIARVSLTGRLAIQVAERLKKPWAVEVVGCSWDALWNYGNWKGKVYAPYAELQNKALIRRAPFVLYVTKEFLQRRYPSKGKTVACSDVELPFTSDDVLQMRLVRIKNKPSPLKIGLIGSMSAKYKGIDVALKALYNAKKELPPFEFHILGGGNAEPFKEIARRLGLSEITYFCGTLPGGNPVLNWLDDIDLYIQPSLTEGLPRALIEAMSRGCPALGSTAGGIPELLDESCLHKPGDSKALSEMIIKSVNNHEWLKQQARRNFFTALDYTKEKIDKARYDFWSEFAQYVKSLNKRKAGEINLN